MSLVHVFDAFVNIKFALIVGARQLEERHLCTFQADLNLPPAHLIRSRGKDPDGEFAGSSDAPRLEGRPIIGSRA